MSPHPHLMLICAVLIVANFTACGSSDGSDTNSTSLLTTSSIDSQTSLASQDSQSNYPNASINHRQLAAHVANELSQRRSACGFGALQDSELLTKLSEKHAKYIQHVFVAAERSSAEYMPHSENTITGLESITGPQNPYYSGDDLAARIHSSSYEHRNNMVGESINTRLIYGSDGLEAVDAKKISAQMLASLLAAPYHLATLMSPAFNQQGTSVLSFVPYGKSHTKSRGFVLVATSGATDIITPPNALLSYPCQDTVNTARMLDNESPNPMKEIGRDLRIDPVGQPVYITNPAATTIKVSNIIFKELGSGKNIAVYLLDHESDPHQGTPNAIPDNAAFIIPLTDGYFNCDARERSPHTNCGLNPHTKYSVSFEVLTNETALIKKTIEFTTGS